MALTSSQNSWSLSRVGRPFEAAKRGTTSRGETHRAARTSSSAADATIAGVRFVIRCRSRFYARFRRLFAGVGVVSDTSPTPLFVAMDGSGGESGQADGDVFGAVSLRRAVAHPFPW